MMYVRLIFQSKDRGPEVIGTTYFFPCLPAGPGFISFSGIADMDTLLRTRLWVMMFFQYFIWSSWYVTMGPYLGGQLNFTAPQIGWAYSATALAAMVSPIFVGMIADRYFAAQKVLAVLHIASGVCLYLASRCTTFGSFITLLMAHTICYMPTLALTNSLSFRQMKDSGKEFPAIRVMGTISWIVGGLAINTLGDRATCTAIPFQVGAAVSLLMGLYCLTLPHTPPNPSSAPVRIGDVLGLDALTMMKDRSFAIFVASAFLICVPLTFYFSFTSPFLTSLNVADIPGKMSMGQMSEIFFMLVMPFFFARLGVKWMLAVGMLCWSLRYGLFMLGYNSGLIWPLYLGILLHGVCYDFFFVTAYIYVDRRAPDAIRSKAQGFIAFVTLGAGMFVGAQLSGLVVDQFSFPKVTPAKTQKVAKADLWATGNYASWTAGEGRAYGKLLEIVRTGSVPGPAGELAGTSNAPVAVVGIYQADAAGVYADTGKKTALPLAQLEKPMHRWDGIWAIPAAAAMVFLFLFLILFKDREEPKPARG
jgi:nucleoside transporter